MRLADKPMSRTQIEKNGCKVALIIRDERPGAIQKANMCGINNQTIFHIPTAPIFLAHKEHLDSIIAYHVKKRLENAGYTVESCYPEIKQDLSQDKVKASHFKKERKAAWNEKGSQNISKSEKKAFKSLGKKGGSIDKEALDESAVSPWGDLINASNTDAVVEIKIKKFWTDYSYFGSVSWMTANLAICSSDNKLRKVLYGDKLKGGGYMFSFFTPLTPSSDATISMNTAYWFVLNALEKELNSPGLLDTIKLSNSNIQK